jgi:2-polyprenyl-3-methyl-5-hydroxy-6-metoxy-1,4-benzoquinol methylase
VTAIDLSDAAIRKCRREHGHLDIRFLAGKIGQLSGELAGPFDVVYSRFVLHAMPLEEEIEVLQTVFGHLRPGGLLHIECRSINDPMAREGEVISPTERIHGHYRRFIVMEGLEARLHHAGFEILESIESNGLAVFGDQDPVVIRIAARRPA